MPAQEFEVDYAMLPCDFSQRRAVDSAGEALTVSVYQANLDLVVRVPYSARAAFDETVPVKAGEKFALITGGDRPQLLVERDFGLVTHLKQGDSLVDLAELPAMRLSMRSANPKAWRGQLDYTARLALA